METKKKTTRKMDLLTAVEQIVDLSKNSHLDAEFFKKAARPIKHLSEKLELTNDQAIIMALFVDNSSDTSIKVSDFAKHLDCSTTRVIRLMSDVDELEKRGLVLCSRDRSGLSYRVPLDVIEAFKRNEKYTPRDCSGMSCAKLFNYIAEFMEMREENELTTEQTINKFNLLLDSNKHLVFVQKLKSYKLDPEDEMLLVVFSHLYANNNDDRIGYYDINFFYDRKIDFNRVKRQLKANNHILQASKMIEYNNDDGFADRESFRMTWSAKKELFPELNLASMNVENDGNDIIKHESIVAKQLYYDKEVTARISDLCQLLEDRNYCDICNRLRNKGFRSGFTCLFYGAPGTGKTETVLQLARQTGRDIMQVNVSEIKSMWVGESEKNIKRLFDQYRERVDKSVIAPILLFNEADAIIGKRQEGAERAVDKMENSIQNIILQEMEKLDGILIATTNLAQNMDKAFERRFLYKIKFNKPTIEARISIWKTMLPDLADNDIRVLAEKYDFSGGQIENIARHYAIGNILHGDSQNLLEEISSYCDSERLETGQTRKIGFNS